MRSVTSWREWLIELVPPLALLALLALASGYAIYFRFRGVETADERALREWLEESRVFRKTLSELGRDYLHASSTEQRDQLRQELEDQVRSMAAPLRQFASHLPLFPTVYRLELRLGVSGSGVAHRVSSVPALPLPWTTDPSFSPPGWSVQNSPEQPSSTAAETVIVWESGLPFDPHQVRRLEHVLFEEPGGQMSAVIWYRLHAFHHQQRLAREQSQFFWGMLGLIVGTSFAAVAWVAVYSLKQRRREQEESAARQRLEEARRLALENELRRRQAEQDALQLRSQMFAHVAVLAGCYAHNIKNLLLRPMALLRECLEEPVDEKRKNALLEIESTLGTVTDRLQEILRAVSRNPTQMEPVVFDLSELVQEVHGHWSVLAQQRWKLDWQLELSPEPIPVFADRSQILQAVENLLFNARDATFEMRAHLRQRAYSSTLDKEVRKQALLQAASWRGLVVFRTSRWQQNPGALASSGQTVQVGSSNSEPATPLPGGQAADHQSTAGQQPQVWAVLEVNDNGAGMTPEVLARCMEPYFTTKRESAIYEGQATGMGLGLAFVRLVMEQHGGRIEIHSQPEAGTVVRLLLPMHRPA